MTVKIVGVCCSPRKGKTTRYALDVCLKAAEEAFPDVKGAVIELAGMDVRGCIACGTCMKKLECSQKDDFPSLIPILSDPDLGGLIVATPVYLGMMTSQCKAFLDRTVMFRRNGFRFRNVAGGALTVGGFRNGGQEAAIQAVHAAMLVHDMVIVGDGSPGAHLGGTLWSNHQGGIEADDLGLTTARSLGARVAEVALKLRGK